jgi:ligand-binding sensor protein
MADFDTHSKHEKIVVLDSFFRHLPKIEQMRDPLKTDWNTELVDESDRENEQLLRLIDFSQMNSLFESFLTVMGLPVAIIDLKGAVLASSKWQRLCIEFHRANEGTLKRCLESDRSILAQLETGKTYSSHQCSNGLIDCASPIIIEGHHVANLFIGQFFIKPPNLDFFKVWKHS